MASPGRLKLMLRSHSSSKSMDPNNLDRNIRPSNIVLVVGPERRDREEDRMKMLGRVALVAAVAVLVASGFAFAAEKGMAQGKVTAVSEKAVTVAGPNGALLTFEVTQGARVYGEGASHKSRALVSSGKPTTLENFVRQGQSVSVQYQEKGGRLYLTQLRVL